MELNRWSNYHAKQTSALKALCPYCTDTANRCHSANFERLPSLLAHLQDVCRPFAPMLNATEVTKGLER
jgi:hypothetical protein